MACKNKNTHVLDSTRTCVDCGLFIEPLHSEARATFESMFGAAPVPGMTKRELFAAMAMLPILARVVFDQKTSGSAARDAVECADALIAELAKPKAVP